MSHPHFHAESSARKFGGHHSDYVALHSTFDSSKAAYADTRHRAILHHLFGVALLTDLLGAHLVRASDGGVVPMTTLGEQHLHEDCGFSPTLQDWLGERPMEPWIERGVLHVPQDVLSARRLGGESSDYTALSTWLDQGVLHWHDPRAHAPLHSAFGIFLAEQRFGTVFRRASDGKPVPTRVAAEAHVIRCHGRIPTVEEWTARIPVAPWMRRGATPLSRILESAQTHTPEFAHA